MDNMKIIKHDLGNEFETIEIVNLADLHIGDAGHRLGQTGQVDFRLVRAWEDAVRDDCVQQGDEVDGLVAREEPQHLRIDLCILAGVEHLRPDDLDQVGQGIRLEQHRAQHTLFGLHVVGQIDAHALQIQFVGIMSFVRHGIVFLSETQKAPPALRGR